MRRLQSFTVCLFALALLCGCAGAVAPAQPVSSGEAIAFEWPISTPEEQGIDPEAIAAAVRAAEELRLNLHSLLVIRHGALVSETYFAGYTAETRHELYSVTKSFTATLVGIAIDQGLLEGVDRRVVDELAGRQFANADAAKSAMTVEHLLSMTSGLDWQEGDPTYRAMYLSDDWVGFVMDLPMTGAPGTEFNYCSGCSHVLSAILQQVAGGNARRFAEQNLFAPLGIQNYAWDVDAEGIPIGGWGLHLVPRDMAKLGYLYLQGGRWQGRQIVSPAWVQAATTRHTATGGDWEYGYQWWLDPEEGAYAARGRFGQLIYVVPALDLVVVTTADSDDSRIVQMIETILLPGCQD